MRYQWCNAEHTVIKVTDDDGDEYFVPTDPGNRHYAQILEDEIVVEEYDPTNQHIVEGPDDLTGGPTIAEVFNVHE
jgi:hypothetical protein